MRAIHLHIRLLYDLPDPDPDGLRARAEPLDDALWRALRAVATQLSRHLDADQPVVLFVGVEALEGGRELVPTSGALARREE